MKIKFNKKQLLDLTNTAIGFTSEKSTMPILGNILLSFKEGVLSMVASDLDIQGKTTTTDTELTEDFSITISAKKLKDTLNVIPNEEVTLELLDAKAVLKAGKLKYTLQTLPAEHFPMLQEPKEEPISEFSMNAVELFNSLERVSFSQGVNDSRAFLNATLLELKHGYNGLNGELSFVATDAHRLGLVKLPMEAKEFSTILPRKTIAEVSRLLKLNNTDLVTVKIYQSQAVFYIGNTSVITTVIQGTYPDYNRVIPVTNTELCTVKGKVLLEAIKRVGVIGLDKMRSIVFTFEDNTLVVAAKNESHDDSTDVIECTYSGKKITANYNVTYWLDLLSRVGESNIDISLFDAARANLIKIHGVDSFTHVIMPLRT
jgi:DNA polymerase-3 subunit beta